MQNWNKLDISGAKPPVRNCHAACCIAGPLTGQKHPILMVIGGWHTDSSTLGDVWLLDVDEAMWSEVGTLYLTVLTSNLASYKHADSYVKPVCTHKETLILAECEYMCYIYWLQ